MTSEESALLQQQEALTQNVADAQKNKFKQMGRAFSEAMEIASASVEALTGIFDSLGVDMDGVFGNIVGGVQEMFSGLASIGKGDPVSVITGVGKTISGLFKSIFGSRDARLEKRIKQSQRAVKQLEYAYSDLEREMNRALGTDKYKVQEKQMDNLKKQQAEVAKQIDLERKKKKSDPDKIAELERKYVELGQQMEDIVNGIKDDLLITAQDAAKQLGDALFEAFANGEDAAKAWGDKVKEIVGEIVKKMLINRILEKPIGKVLDDYANTFINSDTAEVDFEKMVAGLDEFYKNLENVYQTGGKALEALIKDPKFSKFFEQSASGKGLSEGIKGITEDQADLLASYWNAVRQDTASILEKVISLDGNMKGVRELISSLAGTVTAGYSEPVITAEIVKDYLSQQQASNIYLENIYGVLDSTRNLTAQNQAYLKSIEANTYNTAVASQRAAETYLSIYEDMQAMGVSIENMYTLWKDITTGVKSINVK